MALTKIKAESRNVPIPDKIQSLRAVLLKVTGNTFFPNLQGTLPDLKAAVDRLETSFLDAQGARDTAKAKTSIQNDCERDLDFLISNLVEDVNREANGDDVKLQTSGLPLSKAPTPAAAPGALSSFSLSRGDNPGEIDGQCHAEPFARGYESRTIVGEMPSGVWVLGPTFLKSKFTWTGFASGARVWLCIRAKGTNGQGPWSDPMSLIAP